MSALTRIPARLTLLITLCASAMLLPLAAQAESLYIVNKASFHEDADIRPAIRQECQLETKLPEFVYTYAKKEKFDKVELVDSASGHDGLVLTIEIVRAYAPGGGAWTGQKSVTATGKVTKGNKQVGNFTVMRSSAKAYRGTCGLLGRNTKVMGRDIAQWLGKPKPKVDARLGELK